MLTIDFPDVSTFSYTSWTTNTKPNIAVSTEGTDVSQSSSYVYGYDYTGQQLTLSKTNEPTSITLLVKRSETEVAFNPSTLVMLNGKPLGKIFPSQAESVDCEAILDQIEALGDLIYEFSLNNQQVPVWATMALNNLIDLYAEECDPAGGGGNGCTDPCERDCIVADEVLSSFKIAGWGTFEKFDKGWLEKWANFEVLVIQLNTSNSAPLTPAVMISAGNFKKKHILDCSPSPCQGIVKSVMKKVWTNWQLSEIGNRMFYAWTEVDTDVPTVTLTLGINNKFKFKIGDLEIETTITTGLSTVLAGGDDVVALGTIPIFYCDPADSPGTLYDSGDIQFTVKHNN